MNRGANGASNGARGGALFEQYTTLEGAYDELFSGDAKPRSTVEHVVKMLDQLGRSDFKSRKRLADRAMLQGGITFTVYGDKGGTERAFPFDPIPRLVAASEWETLSEGLVQRINALNAFLADVYGERRILAEGVVPRDVVESSRGLLPEVQGIVPPHGVFAHIAGIDLIRDGEGNFLVLEDNLRCPSGVSYVMQNRAVMKRVMPRVFANSQVASVDAYSTRLLETLKSCAPVDADEAQVVLLTPGPFNSAYFEHTFLARGMGCDLVVASDLFVENDRVFMKTTTGPIPVHVIYRRIDDDFLDPDVFRPDSLLGVPGLIAAYRAGNVTLVNAPGNGVADDKAVYPFVPDMIRFYLSEEPKLGQVPTLLCSRDEDRAQVLESPGSYVTKSVDASGGYGLVMGPSATQSELEELCASIRANPRGYISQPLVELSTAPTWTGNEVAPRRLDLRPFILTGDQTWVLPGGLTRVAMKAGSYVVNSSQGGGSKDTWIMDDPR